MEDWLEDQGIVNDEPTYDERMDIGFLLLADEPLEDGSEEQ